MTPLEVLVAARELIADEKRWTTENDAEDGLGDHCSATSPMAVCWCANGALDKVADGWKEAEKARLSLARLAPAWVDTAYMSVAKVNDEDGHAAILKLFDDAIAHERAS